MHLLLEITKFNLWSAEFTFLFILKTMLKEFLASAYQKGVFLLS